MGFFFFSFLECWLSANKNMWCFFKINRMAVEEMEATSEGHSVEKSDGDRKEWDGPAAGGVWRAWGQQLVRVSQELPGKGWGSWGGHLFPLRPIFPFFFFFKLRHRKLNNPPFNKFKQSSVCLCVRWQTPQSYFLLPTVNSSVQLSRAVPFFIICSSVFVFQLKDKCFTVLHWFLPNTNMNQP